MANDERQGGSTDDASSPEHTSGDDVRTALIQLSSGETKAVQYTVVNGLAIFEGDIILGTVEQVELQTERLRRGDTGDPLTEAVAITGTRFRWANCRIPYTIDPALPSQNRVTEAIAHWEANTNYRFVVRTSETDYVTFTPGDGCSSSVGKQTGQQFVNLAGGCLRGQTIHEIGHVVGLWHEQSREDRDLFVRIHWANIQAGKEHNFNQHVTDGDDIGGYDYGSIMHYGATAFSRDNVSVTIETINPAGSSIGQRTSLSAGDIAAANSLCSRGTGPVTLKEPIRDPIQTRKELIKDIRLDTRKEVILDTRKEIALDKRFDPINPIGPVKFDVRPGLGLTTPRAGGGGGTGPLPFPVAAGRQAPGAGDAAGDADSAAQLDAQLQALADAIAQAQAQLQSLQDQYDETAAVLTRLLDQNDPESGR